VSDHALIALVGAALGATGPGLILLFVGSWHKRQEEQRKETGKRIGRLERQADYDRGVQAERRRWERRTGRRGG
jgi:hypothetical protein